MHIVAFAPWVDAPLSSISKLIAREWFSLLCGRRSSNPAHKRSAKPLAAQTLKNILNLVRRCFADALEEELIAFNPFAGLKVHRSRSASTKERSTVLAPREQEAALRALEPLPERWMVAFALGTGVRQGEQWSLKLTDLVLGGDRPSALLRYGSEGAPSSEEDGPTKAGKVRRVRLFGLALDAAERWVAQLVSYAPENPLGLVFPTRSGKRRQCGKTFYGWRLLVKAVGRPVRWHDLRHSCGTSLAAGWWGSVWSLEEICRYFGHSSIKVTERYARLVDELAEKAAERMAPRRVPLHVPVLVRRAPRARRRSVQSRGDVMTDSNAKTDGDSGRSGRVVYGSGFENREPSPNGVEKDETDAAQTAFVAERARANENAEGHFAALKIAECEKRRADENAKALLDAVAQVAIVAKERDVARAAFAMAESALFEARNTSPEQRSAPPTREPRITLGRSVRIVRGPMRHRYGVVGKVSDLGQDGTGLWTIIVDYDDGARVHCQAADLELVDDEQRSPKPAADGLLASEAAMVDVLNGVYTPVEDASARDLAYAERLCKNLRAAGPRGSLFWTAAEELHRFATCWWEAENRVRDAMAAVSTRDCTGCVSLGEAYDTLHDASDKALEKFAETRSDLYDAREKLTAAVTELAAVRAEVEAANARGFIRGTEWAAREKRSPEPLPVDVHEARFAALEQRVALLEKAEELAELDRVLRGQR